MRKSIERRDGDITTKLKGASFSSAVVMPNGQMPGLVYLSQYITRQRPASTDITRTLESSRQIRKGSESVLEVNPIYFYTMW